MAVHSVVVSNSFSREEEVVVSLEEHSSNFKEDFRFEKVFQ